MKALNIDRLIDELNQKQQEIVKQAEIIGEDGSLYDFKFELRKRSVITISSHGAYTDFSFTMANAKEKFNRRINSLNTQLEKMKDKR